MSHSSKIQRSIDAAISEADIIELRTKLDEIMNIDKKLDEAHSIWKRLKAVDENGYGKCTITGEPLKYDELVCGHFIKRRHTLYRWDDLNTEAISPVINSREESEPLFEPMRDYKISTLGFDIVEEMERKAQQNNKMSRWDKETLLKTRRLQIRKLLETKNFTVNIP